MEIFNSAIIANANASITFCNSYESAKETSEKSAEKMDFWEESYDILIGKAFFSKSGKLYPGNYTESISNDKVWKPADMEMDPYQFIKEYYEV